MAQDRDTYNAQKPSDGRYAELGAADPEGNRFDISVKGWATERDQPDA